MAFSVDSATRYLEKAHRQGRLAHGYLITGGEGCSEEEELAAAMIRLVNGASGDSLESLRSGIVHLVQPESKSRRIKVKQIRDLESRLYLAAPAGKKKVAVIREADRLGAEAENAFLKTLEEPPADSLILLLTPHPEQLLDTILSRCIRIPLKAGRVSGAATPEEERLLAALEDHFRKEGGGVVRSLGLAGRFQEILRTVKTEITKRHDALLKDETATYQKRIEGDWLEQREDYLKAMSETEYIEKRNRLVNTLLAFLGDALRLQQGIGHLDLPRCRAVTEGVGRRFEVRELIDRFAALEKLRSLLDTNTQEKLALEATFLRAFG